MSAEDTREALVWERLDEQMRATVLRVWDDWRQGLADGAFNHADGMRFKLRIEAAIGNVTGQFQREAASRLAAPVSERWERVPDRHPPPHARYLVRRGGVTFTATPCYGIHAPWWVVKTMEGEAPPVPFQPGDEWMVPHAD